MGEHRISRHTRSTSLEDEDISAAGPSLRKEAIGIGSRGASTGRSSGVRMGLNMGATAVSTAGIATSRSLSMNVSETLPESRVEPFPVDGGAVPFLATFESGVGAGDC
jgi:hypothetical protein